MAYETKLPRPASSATVTEDLSEGSEVFPVALRVLTLSSPLWGPASTLRHPPLG